MSLCRKNTLCLQNTDRQANYQLSIVNYQLKNVPYVEKKIAVCNFFVKKGAFLKK